MFIRPCYRHKNGKRHAYWALVESYRTDRGPRQRVVSYLGQLKESERLGIKQAATGNNKTAFKQLRLFGADSKPEPEWAEVDTANIRVENQLDFGGPWLGLQLIGKLKFDELFADIMPQGREDIPWSKMALVLMICRLCNPSSELYIAEHYYKSTAMPELLGIPAEKVYDKRLYRALDKLLPHKVVGIAERKRKQCTNVLNNGLISHWKRLKPAVKDVSIKKKQSTAGLAVSWPKTAGRQDCFKSK